jgi:hypothetical protein
MKNLNCSAAVMGIPNLQIKSLAGAKWVIAAIDVKNF